MSTAEQILNAWLWAAAKRNARDRSVSTERAVAEIRELAGNRPDLLAEVAGISLGCGEGQLDSDVYARMAELCVLAGADEALIEQWVAVGRGRAAQAAVRPNTSGHSHQR